MMAAADGVYVTVHGEGGHGSAPHLARDPIPAACEMVMALQTVVARRVDPARAAVVTVGQFHAGTKRTIIPDQARFEVTVRTIDHETQQLVRSAIVDICEHIAQAHGLRASVEYDNEFGLTFNSPGETAFAQSVVTELFGPERAVPMAAPSMGSEDFSRVLDAVPGAMVFLGACPPDLDPAEAPYNHAPTAMFDDAVLSDGAHLYAELATRTLAAAAPSV
jgi:amidohydrolase